MSAAEAQGDAAGAVAAGGLAYVDDRLDEARSHWERAFKGLRQVGDLAGAARVATLLGELHWGGLGNPSTGRGWLERARRLLDDAGPCVEQGYWELARLACDRPDAIDLERSADRALAVAIEYGDLGLETRARADRGFALVCQGRLKEGFALLEDALATLSTGELADPFAVSTTCCALLSACDRAGDTDRATEWVRMIRELVLAPAGGRPRMLGAHCMVALGGVLCTAGRWAEAEQAILAALDHGGGATAAQRVDATVRLAELRLAAGRADEAAELLAPVEDQPAAAAVLARLHLSRDDAELAVVVIRRAMEQLTGDVLRQASLLGLLVEAEVACGHTEIARSAADRLRELAERGEIPVVSGLASLAEGRVAVAAGDSDAAVSALGAAVTTLALTRRPVPEVEAHLALAEALEHRSPSAAIASARAAHAVALRTGLVLPRDRSAALLRRLGVTAPRSAPTAAVVEGLSAREVEVLEGLRRGDSNAQIAKALFLSPKTVEHHVSRVLGKLGVRTRAEAAAVAASMRATGSS